MDKPHYEELSDLIDSEGIVTNDGVAGETVDRGAGDGNDGPTGGSPREGAPTYAETDDTGEALDEDEL